MRLARRTEASLCSFASRDDLSWLERPLFSSGQAAACLGNASRSVLEADTGRTLPRLAGLSHSVSMNLASDGRA